MKFLGHQPEIHELGGAYKPQQSHEGSLSFSVRVFIIFSLQKWRNAIRKWLTQSHYYFRGKAGSALSWQAILITVISSYNGNTLNKGI